MSRRHPTPRLRGRHYQLEGTLGTGVALSEGGTLSQLVPIAGMLRMRVRALVTGGAATLRARFVYPDTNGLFDEANLHTTGSPADVVLVADTEGLMEIAELFGEAFLLISLIDAGGGAPVATISRVVVSDLS